MALVRPKNIPTANLSGILSNSQIPVLSEDKVSPGSIVQVAYNRYDPGADTYISVAVNTEAKSEVTLTMTPKFANSKLLVIARMHTRFINAYGVAFGLYRDNVKQQGQVNVEANDFNYKGSTENHHYTGFILNHLDAGSTNPTTFQPWAMGRDNGTWEVSYGWGEHSITVMEIKQ